MNRKDKKTLEFWKNKYQNAKSAYTKTKTEMDDREKLYRGDNELKPIIRDQERKTTPYVRNIVAELIDSQVSTAIPRPKVTALRKEDDGLAQMVEHMVTNKLNQISMVETNDIMERTVPLQGGSYFQVEWDSTIRRGESMGDLRISARHPKAVIPQPGVTSSVEDMDYIFLEIPQTRSYIKRKYGVTLDDRESEPGARSLSEDGETAEDMVTQVYCYHRNQAGGIGLVSWVEETLLDNLEDYQARRLRVCKQCGAPEPIETSFGEELPEPEDPEGTIEKGQQDMERKTRPRPGSGRKVCEFCGGTKFEERDEDYQVIMIPRVELGTDMAGNLVEQTIEEPMEVPYYKPDLYPFILQKNISAFGKLLGESDADRIAGAQNNENGIDAVMLENLLAGGSYMFQPPDTKVTVNEFGMKVVVIERPDQKELFDVKTMQADISQHLAAKQQYYEEARQILGVTDSYQGRRDTTATSGKAKEIAVQQSAGRLESKRQMKHAAYARLFELIFKFMLAYEDELVPIISKNAKGKSQYGEFNRFAFLRQDEDGKWSWNTDFIFEVDTTGGLAENRQALWEETTKNFQIGTFGPPQQTETLVTYWRTMEELHYPMAAQNRKLMEEKLQQQMAAMQQQMAAAAQTAEAYNNIAPQG